MSKTPAPDDNPVAKIRNAPAWRGVCRGTALGLITLGLVLVSVAWRATTHAASAATQGTATLTDNNGTAITSGKIDTPFVVALSDPGVCSGSSSAVSPNPQYFVFSFVIAPPASGSSVSAELGGITWDANTYPTSAYPLIDTAGNEYGPSNTSTAGQPLAPAGGEFSFKELNDQLTSNSLSPLTGQSWEVGYVCESNGQTVDYWSDLVTFDASGNWTQASDGTGSSTTTTTSTSTTSTTSTTTTTTTTTVPDSTTTSTDTGTSTTTAAGGSTTTTAPGSSALTGDTTGGSQAGTGAPEAGSGSGSSGDPATGATSPGSGTTLANTGARVKMELNIAILLIGGGIVLYLLVTPLPPRLLELRRREVDR